MFEDGKHIRAAREAYRLAFPNEDAEAFVSRWIASRGEDLAASMVHMARISANRCSSLVDASANIVIDHSRPCIVALLHYSTDPVLQLAMIGSNPARDFRWPLYPPQPGVEDDRSLWLTRTKIPLAIERMLLPVTKPSWAIAARDHLEQGGDIFIAMDAPFDRERPSAASLRIGEITMPIAASIDFLARRTDAQLLFAWPEIGQGKRWVLHVDAVADTSELARAATSWIADNRLYWAGWPYLRWREMSVSMRRNMARLQETPTLSLAPTQALDAAVGSVAWRSKEGENASAARQGKGETALLFPGQGSQTAEMRKRVERFCPELAIAAAELVGDDPFTRMDDGTAFAQPAIFCANIAGWYAARDLAGSAVGVVGHSLGEFGALVAAGSIDALDALRLVVLRGRLMQEVERTAGSGGMAAVLGKDLSDVSELARQCGLVVANDNAPHQVVLSGPDAALDALLEVAPSRGVRAVRLPVGGAFHSPVMQEVVEEFRVALANTEIGPPKLLALCSTTAAPFADIREDLAGGITRPVLWRQCVQWLRREGIAHFLDIGPGRVLSRLVTATCGDSAQATAVEDYDTLSDSWRRDRSKTDPTQSMSAIGPGASDDR